jgi:hypothetical protein
LKPTTTIGDVPLLPWIADHHDPAENLSPEQRYQIPNLTSIFGRQGGQPLAGRCRVAWTEEQEPWDPRYRPRVSADDEHAEMLVKDHPAARSVPRPASR